MYRKSWIFVIAAVVLLTSVSPLTAAARGWNPAALYKLSPAGTSFIPDNANNHIANTAPELQETAARSATEGKTVYLTFDDGPSRLTPSVLNILDQYKVKATFFVLGQQAQRSPELIRQIVDGGHALGNHTFDHNYGKLYHNFSDFWGQIKQTEEILREITGTRTQLVRAPGGTYGHFDETYFSLLDQAGYKVFDWDVDSGDSARQGVPVPDILKQAKDNGGLKQVVLLMHDGSGHDNTVKALPEIIETYKAEGYSFAVLGPETKPVQFPVGGKLPAGRTMPSQAWIASHIEPNAALFDRSQLPLEISAGGVQTVMNAGEYRVSNGAIQVPVRAAAERLGAKVEWDAKQKQVRVQWGSRAFVSLPLEAGIGWGNRSMFLKENAKDNMPAYSQPKQPPVVLVGNTVWISLRTLLEALEHPIVKINKTEKQWEIKAS